MNREDLKKDMLIKKEDGDFKLFRILAVQKEKVLVQCCFYGLMSQSFRNLQWRKSHLDQHTST